MGEQTNSMLDAIYAAQQMMDALGPVPFWASHTLLPADAAYRFTFRNIEYVGAHPDFWAQLPAHPKVRVSFDVNPLGSITVRNLDADDAAREQFYDALAGAIAAGQAA